jgi:hypothetical protein
MGLFKVTGGVATPFLQTKHTYELVDANGKVIETITREQYLEYENDPDSDKPTKRTTDPDVYGRKCGGSPSDPKVCPKEKKEKKDE